MEILVFDDWVCLRFEWIVFFFFKALESDKCISLFGRNNVLKFKGFFNYIILMPKAIPVAISTHDMVTPVEMAKNDFL